MSERFRAYELTTGPAMKLTSLGTTYGDSMIDCARKCTITDGCGAVKMTDAGDNERKICTMYTKPDGVSVVQETNIYVTDYQNDN